MSQAENVSIAQELLSQLGRDAAPADTAKLFDDKLEMEIAGDPHAFPWIGRRSGRAAFTQFLVDAAVLLERISLEVHDILASEDKAVILGALVSKVKQTGRLIQTGFAMVLTVADGRIVGFQLLEDSFAASSAAHTNDEGAAPN